MRRRLTRPLALGSAALLASIGLAVSMQTPAAAATGTLAASGTYDAQDSARFQIHQVTGSDGGQYIIQTNLWNKAVAGGYSVNWNDQSTAWTLTNNTANSYFPELANPVPNTQNAEPTEAGVACTAGSDPLDTGCNWAGRGDPYVNPNTGAQDQFATTNTMPSFVPQQPPAGTNHVVGLTNEFSNQIHAPASYADIFLGCHWGTCTPGTTSVIPNGAPFPLQYTGVSRLDSVWTINVPAAGVYDAAYDIWLDSNTRNCPTSGQTCASPPAPMPLLPTQPKSLNGPGQNDGAEVMIWVGHNGYKVTPAGSAQQLGIIQPAGTQLNMDANKVVTPVTIQGINNPDGTQAQFDVWGGRSRSFDNGVRWNVITFVNRSPVRSGGLVTPGLSNGGFDGKAFIDYAATLGSKCSVNTNNTPLPAETVNCLDPHWWLTSVQAGYEIWSMGSDQTMGTTNFSVRPIAVSGGAETGNRSCPPPNGCAGSAPTGTPLVNWLDTFNIVAQGCPNDTNATWQLAATNFIDGANPVPNVNYPATLPAAGQPGLGRLTESPAGSGNYVSVPQAGPLNNPAAGFVFHDVATITITIHCNGQTKTSTGTVFIDPSGEVLDLNNKPVQGAQVTLLRSTTQAGPFTTVANGDTTVMSPANTANPSTTDSAGRFRWDVVTGWYEVSASKAGCTQVGGSVSAPEHVLPPPASPVTAIKLTLDCGGGGLPTTVVVRPPGVTQFGYCADITVTNNTNAPVVWNTHFTIPGGQHINQHWNMVLTQIGDQATNVHADPSNPWNAVLQPGQSTTSTGFCAVP